MTSTWYRLRMPQVSFRSIRFASCFVCVVAFGCGGGALPAGTPRAANTEHAAPTDSTHSTASAAASTAPAATAEAAPEKPAEPVITRTVSERVFAPRVSYMVNYPSSGAKDVAEHKCSVKFPAPEAKAACLDKERDKFTADVLVFEKTDKGQWVSIYKRSGNALSQMSKSKVALGEDTTDSLSIKVEDDKGWRPIFAGKKKFEVRLRDEYSIVLDDPQYGNLVYDARIGLID